ncbi:MAG: TPM domain-containing protein [Clostridia bacterium]|nr:TPM domain-containing protein [Clostridia bacterium]
MKKSKISLLLIITSLIVVFSSFLTLPSQAADAASSKAHSPIFDNAGVLSENDIVIITDKLEKIRSKYGIDVAFATAEENISTSALVDYADLFAERNLAGDNILIMANFPDGADGSKRDWQISTSGKGITVLTDYGIETIFDAMEEAADDRDDYLGMLSAFAGKVYDYIDIYETTGEPFDLYEDNSPHFLRKGIISAFIGLIASMIGTGSLKGQLNSVYSQRAAGHYTKKDSMQVTEASELFLFSTVTKTRIQSDSSSRSGGGSSTHSSSSGGSHGGGGRSF